MNYRKLKYDTYDMVCDTDCYTSGLCYNISKAKQLTKSEKADIQQGIQIWKMNNRMRCGKCKVVGHNSLNCNRVCKICDNIHNNNICIISLLNFKGREDVVRKYVRGIINDCCKKMKGEEYYNDMQYKLWSTEMKQAYYTLKDLKRIIPDMIKKQLYIKDLTILELVNGDADNIQELIEINEYEEKIIRCKNVVDIIERRECKNRLDIIHSNNVVEQENRIAPVVVHQNEDVAEQENRIAPKVINQNEDDIIMIKQEQVLQDMNKIKQEDYNMTELMVINQNEENEDNKIIINGITPVVLNQEQDESIDNKSMISESDTKEGNNKNKNKRKKMAKKRNKLIENGYLYKSGMNDTAFKNIMHQMLKDEDKLDTNINKNEILPLMNKGIPKEEKKAEIDEVVKQVLQAMQLELIPTLGIDRIHFVPKLEMSRKLNCEDNSE